MQTFKGHPVTKGHASGPALFTDKAVNFTAAFTKPENLIPGHKAVVRDQHHPWFKQDVYGKVLIIPTAIGSTHTGLVLLDLVRLEKGPVAMVVDAADSLLVSGIVLSEVWYGRSIPVVEYPTQELRDAVKEGATVEVDGETGEIRVTEA